MWTEMGFNVLVFLLWNGASSSQPIPEFTDEDLMCQHYLAHCRSDFGLIIVVVEVVAAIPALEGGQAF